MPSPQKYSLRIACVPSNAIEGVTYMDLAAIQEEVKRAQGDYEYAVFDCVDADDSKVKVLIKAADIQMIMHHEFKRPVQGQIAIPQAQVPKPQLM